MSIVLSNGDVNLMASGEEINFPAIHIWDPETLINFKKINTLHKGGVL